MYGRSTGYEYEYLSPVLYSYWYRLSAPQLSVASVVVRSSEPKPEPRTSWAPTGATRNLANGRAYENAFKKPESARSKTENANAKRITERGVALVWFRVGTKEANPLWDGQVTPSPPRARP